MSLPNYDAWLEAPYVNAARREHAFELFCEEHHLDPDDEDAWVAFEEEYER